MVPLPVFPGRKKFLPGQSSHRWPLKSQAGRRNHLPEGTREWTHASRFRRSVKTRKKEMARRVFAIFMAFSLRSDHTQQPHVAFKAWTEHCSRSALKSKMTVFRATTACVETLPTCLADPWTANAWDRFWLKIEQNWDLNWYSRDRFFHLNPIKSSAYLTTTTTTRSILFRGK